MIFMNDYDIAIAEQRVKPGTVKAMALQILKDHMEVINSNSDGWAYWSAPTKAAKRLMELIQGPNTVSELTASQCLKTAVKPLRAFYTKHPELPRPVYL